MSTLTLGNTTDQSARLVFIQDEADRSQRIGAADDGACQQERFQVFLSSNVSKNASRISVMWRSSIGLTIEKQTGGAANAIAAAFTRAMEQFNTEGGLYLAMRNAVRGTENIPHATRGYDPLLGYTTEKLRAVVKDLELGKRIDLKDPHLRTNLKKGQALSIIQRVFMELPIFDYTTESKKEDTVTKATGYEKLEAEMLAEVATRAQEPAAQAVANTPPVNMKSSEAVAAVAELLTKLDLMPSETGGQAQSLSSSDGAIGVPGPQPEFRPTQDWTGAWEVMDNHEGQHGSMFMLVTGPTGCGKTTGAIAYAHKANKPMLVVDCTAAVEPTDLFGAMVAKSGSTEFVLSDLAKALKTPKCIILLDEINRAPHEVRNALLALLDSRGNTTIPGVMNANGEPVRLSSRSDIVFIGTANIGSGYVGTERLDSAFRNRALLTVRVEYLSKLDECRLIIRRCGLNTPEGLAQAKAIADTAAWTREEASKPTGGKIADAISTRQSLHAGMLCASGVDTEDAIRLSCINSFDDEQDRAVLDAVVDAACTKHECV